MQSHGGGKMQVTQVQDPARRVGCPSLAELVPLTAAVEPLVEMLKAGFRPGCFWDESCCTEKGPVGADSRIWIEICCQHPIRTILCTVTYPLG